MDNAVLTGLGLSAPAGLNAYIPLLVLGVNEGWSWPLLAAFGLLLAVEVVVDKIAGADHANDAIQTFVRPVAGAALMLLTTDEELSELADVLLGGGLAGAVHAVKAGTRGAVTLTTLGVGNPVASTIEAPSARTSSILAIAIPLLAIALLAGMAALAIWLLRRRVRPAAPPP